MCILFLFIYLHSEMISRRLEDLQGTIIGRHNHNNIVYEDVLLTASKGKLK